MSAPATRTQIAASPSIFARSVICGLRVRDVGVESGVVRPDCDRDLLTMTDKQWQASFGRQPNMLLVSLRKGRCSRSELFMSEPFDLRSQGRLKLRPSEQGNCAEAQFPSPRGRFRSSALSDNNPERTLRAFAACSPFCGRKNRSLVGHKKASLGMTTLLVSST